MPTIKERRKQLEHEKVKKEGAAIIYRADAKMKEKTKCLLVQTERLVLLLTHNDRRLTVLLSAAGKKNRISHDNAEEVPNGNVFGGNGYGIDPDKSPDFIIERQVLDCYAPDSTILKNILDTLRVKTTKQARRIVLNLNDYPVEKRTELIDHLISQTHKDLKHLDELLIIEDRQVTRAYWRFE